MSNIEDDVKILKEFTEICKRGISVYNPQEAGEALEHILAEREQKDKRIQELETKLEIKEYGDLDNLQFEEYMNQFVPKQAIIDLIENKTINISGFECFECVAIEDIQELLEGEK